MRLLLFIAGTILFSIFWFLMVKALFLPEPIEYPTLRERFGTIMWHSSDKDGVFQGSYNDPNAVDHTYCYYPKPETNSNLIIKRVDSGDCSNWYGQVIFREGSWISEKEKYQ